MEINWIKLNYQKIVGDRWATKTAKSGLNTGMLRRRSSKSFFPAFRSRCCPEQIRAYNRQLRQRCWEHNIRRIPYPWYRYGWRDGELQQEQHSCTGRSVYACTGKPVYTGCSFSVTVITDTIRQTTKSLTASAVRVFVVEFPRIKTVAFAGLCMQ